MGTAHAGADVAVEPPRSGVVNDECAGLQGALHSGGIRKWLAAGIKGKTHPGDGAGPPNEVDADPRAACSQTRGRAIPGPAAAGAWR